MQRHETITVGKRSTSERDVINQQERLKSLGKNVCFSRIKRPKDSTLQKWIRKLKQKRYEDNLWWSSASSLSHAACLRQKWVR